MADSITLFKSPFWFWKFSLWNIFFSKLLYQPSPNAISVIPFENGKFKPDDTKKFYIGMAGMGKAKKDNVLKPNGIPAPVQYWIKFHFFLLF